MCMIHNYVPNVAFYAEYKFENDVITTCMHKLISHVHYSIW